MFHRSEKNCRNECSCLLNFSWFSLNERGQYGLLALKHYCTIAFLHDRLWFSFLHCESIVSFTRVYPSDRLKRYDRLKLCIRRHRDFWRVNACPRILAQSSACVCVQKILLLSLSFIFWTASLLMRVFHISFPKGRKCDGVASARLLVHFPHSLSVFACIPKSDTKTVARESSQ